MTVLRGWWWVRPGATAVCAAALVVSCEPAAPPPRHPVLSAAPVNPRHNVQPTMAFERACYNATTLTVACDKQAILNINRARQAELLPGLRLPAGFAGLSAQAQVVAVSNAERAARGLSVLTSTPAADTVAQAGADLRTDRLEPAGFHDAWGGNWAGVADPLAADFLWMYDDGAGGPNRACTRAGAPSCWGHRDNILGTSWTTTGAGSAGASLTQLFVARPG
jgi:uncharacterized protein YkwD